MKTELLSCATPAEREKSVARAAELLKKGELVGIPTETVYGLGANALDASAVAKIFAAKGRPGDNPLIIHVTGPDALFEYCSEVPERALELAERFWPGPLTIVLPSRGNVPREVTAGLDTIAVRCPDSPLTLEVIARLGAPIAAPSANISGHPSTTEAAHVMADMGGKIAAVLDGGSCRVGVESTIIDLSCDPPKLLRPGGITPAQLMQSGPLELDPAVYRLLGPDEKPRAPGMKYRHYAPRGEVTLIKGAAKAAADYVNSKGAPERTAVLCFDGERELYRAAVVIEIGAEEDYDTQAERVFNALRRVDSDAIDFVFARCPKPDGVGLAVVNRLGKAAAHRVVEV
ncbi:MAG: threonylcarbamoyl-AMP synthase [Oscillospiraceae bacterium]|nr:threonylcarbamoyl-AMP synthase [Oscillospiraceae bacterium]